MLPESDLEVGQLRLLDVDNRVNVPVDTHVRLVVQSTDVIHDFAVPSLGIKLDAVQGRLNQTSILAEREGTFYGQCSEICGVYHGFMPIAVDSLSLYEYLSWLSNMGGVALVPVIGLTTKGSNIFTTWVKSILSWDLKKKFLFLFLLALTLGALLFFFLLFLMVLGNG